MRFLSLALVGVCATSFPLETPSASLHQHWNVSDSPDAVSMLQLHALARRFGANRLPAESSIKQGSNRSKKKSIHSEKKAYVSPIAGCEGIDCVKQYVMLPDTHYSWKDTGRRLSGIDKSSSVNFTGYVLNMTSQSWLTEANVDFPIWWHILVIILPSNLEFANWSTLSLEFGINDANGLKLILNRSPDDEIVLDEQSLESNLGDLEKAIGRAVRVAAHTRSIGACLFNPMNEYETFSNDPLHLPRSQDAIKSYSWEDFLKHGGDQPERLVDLPIVKSAVRAMDTVTAFTATMASGQVTRFGVWGYSKLGLATMMVGAIDRRVEAIAPAALIENIPYNLQRAFQKNPGESLLQGLDQYEFLNKWVGTQEWKNLYQIVSFEYWIGNLTMATFFTMDTDDTWFDIALSDISQWWPHMPEPKNLLMMEAQHDNVIFYSAPAVTAFFHAHLLGKQMPKIEYSLNQNSELVVQQVSFHTPTSVNLHSSNTCIESYDHAARHFYPRYLKSDWHVESLKCDSESACTNWVADMDTNKINFDQVPNLSSLSQADKLPSELFRHNCSHSAYISFSYRGPSADDDPFQISTPIYVVHQ